MIIDSHAHLPAIHDGFDFKQSLDKLLMDMDRNKIDYAILIPDNIHNSTIGDLAKLIELTAGNSRLFLMGTLDVRTDGTEWINKLDSLMAAGKIHGIKIFPGHDPIYPTDIRLMPIYEMCQKHGMPVVIHTGWNSGNPEASKYNDPKYIVRISDMFPKLKIVIAHYFWPNVEYCYNITRGYDNIYFDTSGLADDEVADETGYELIKDILEKTIHDRPESVIFGTDYAMCDIKKHLDLVDSLGISDDEKQMVLWKNANRLFRLGLNL